MSFKNWHKRFKKGILPIPYKNWIIIKQYILNKNRSQANEIKRLINDSSDESFHVESQSEEKQTLKYHSIDEIKNNFKKGLNLFDSGDYQEALKYFDKVVLLNPSCTKVHYWKGKIFETIGSYFSALDCYDKVLNIDTACTNALHNKGICLRIMGKIDESNKCFDDILKKTPYNVPVLLDKGYNLLNQKEYQ